MHVQEIPNGGEELARSGMLAGEVLRKLHEGELPQGEEAVQIGRSAMYGLAVASVLSLGLWALIGTAIWAAVR